MPVSSSVRNAILARFFPKPPALRHTFLGLPPELRNMIYQFLFSEFSKRPSPPVLEYHFCNKTYEVTKRFQRLVGVPSIPVLTPILRTCRQVYHEALPVLHDHGMVLASLRPATDAIDLSRGIGRVLRLARSLELHISIAYPCQLAPNPEWNDAPSVMSKTRRKSWNGQPSAGSGSTSADSSRQSMRARSNLKSWSGPTHEQMCFLRYLQRLRALLRAFNDGANLSRLTIFIENTDHRLTYGNLTSLIEVLQSRLRVQQDCIVSVQLDPQAQSMTSSIEPEVPPFLKELQR